MENICGNKYKISIKNNTIILPVSLENLPSKVIIYGNELLLKSSFHVSLVCINEIIRKHTISIPNFRDSIVEDFCDFVKTNGVDILNYTEEFRFAAQNDLKTVIVACNMSSLDKFFEIINKKYGLTIEYPLTHVTLYAHDGGTGIFLTDSEDIKNLTKPIPNPIGRSL